MSEAGKKSEIPKIRNRKASKTYKKHNNYKNQLESIKKEWDKINEVGIGNKNNCGDVVKSYSKNSVQKSTTNALEPSFEKSKDIINGSPQKETIELDKVKLVDTQKNGVEIDQPDNSIKTKKVLKPKAFVFSTLNSNDYFSLPIITLDFRGIRIKALLDTGSSISLIQSHIIQEIKKINKIKYLSHNLKIQTINHNSIPYFAAACLTLKIQQKWCKGTFFITTHAWNTPYDAVLGTDFIHKNRISVDVTNNTYALDHKHFPFDFEIHPTISDDNAETINEDEIKSKWHENASVNQHVVEKKFDARNVARVLHSVVIKPGKFGYIYFSIPKKLQLNEYVKLNVKDNFQHIIKTQVIHKVYEKLKNFIMITNNTDRYMHFNKNMILGELSPFVYNNAVFTQELKNNVSSKNNDDLNKVHELRKRELKSSDFDVSHIKEPYKSKILEMLLDIAVVFSKSYASLGLSSEVVPEFSLMHQYPIRARPYRTPSAAQAFAKKEIQQLLDAKIISHSQSPYSFPVVFVPKKQNPNDKERKYRLAVDFRLLNDVTEAFPIQLPLISDILHNISGQKYYVSLDLKSAFLQLNVKPEDTDKLSFSTEWGQFKFHRLPYGLKNSSSYFHLLIQKCLGHLKGKHLQYFLNDVILAHYSIDELIKILQIVFDRLKAFNLTLEPQKVQLFKKEINYL